ncbi:NADH-quinone oxidoreductase subunit H [Caminibacter mediatlanticus TB-2]|uniref:NADH-quinone oxidoreductase subunit H n=1 Tax=Caminibacter mediatlanticus TB-2 TaxID=391592 RepID=A0ABX5VAB8_9BACT|nr:NADH-quinone oxidoreductase subunit H [Caminibacter mediatlanticus]QCT95208.1 NADH-quinone oxidoreductase subunit H [Caminibacter mediatlanticus TB-2]
MSTTLFWMVVQVLAVVAVAPFFDGVARMIRAKMQARKGPPDPFQTYRDLYKLFKRGRVYPKNAHWVFKYAPYIMFGVVATMLAALPITYATDFKAGVVSDLFVILYLGAFFRFIFGVASNDSGNAFAAIGGSREQMIGVFVEPVIVLCLIVVMLLAKTSNLVEIQYMVKHWQIGYIYPSFAIASIAFLWAMYVEMARNPYDLAEAEQELQEGVLGEYSGSDLAISHMTMLIKQFVMIGLFLSIFEPWNVEFPLLALLIYIIKAGVFYVGAVFIDNFGPRYKLLSSFKRKANFALVIAFMAVITYVLGA